MFSPRHIRSVFAAAVFVAVARADEVATEESQVARANSGPGQNPVAQQQLRDMNALYASPWTVNPGHAQLETYMIQYARDHDRTRSSDTVRETWIYGPMTLKAGLLHNLDLEF